MTSPLISSDQAIEILCESYGILEEAIVHVSSLGSCQDCNFKVVVRTTTADEQNCFVLKISNSSVTIADLEFENDILKYLNDARKDAAKDDKSVTFKCPKVFPLNNRNEYISRCIDKTTNKEHYARLLSYVDGIIFSKFGYLSTGVLESFGEHIAHLDLLLKNYQPTVMIPQSPKSWDMRACRKVVTNYFETYNMGNDPYCKRLLTTFNAMEEIISQNSCKFSEQVVHGDLAYYNVIVSVNKNGRPFVDGIIDFGDVCRSWIIGNLAVAIAPILIQNHKPSYLIGCDILRGYLKQSSLNKEEVLSMWPLIVQRCILLYVGIYHQLQEDPMNQYCLDEIKLNKQILEHVLAVPLIVAQEAMLQTAQMNNVEDIRDLNAFQSILASKDYHFCPIDLTIKSDIYKKGNWLQKDENPLVDKAIGQHHTNELKKTIFFTQYGEPHLSQSKLLSHDIPETIPLFTTVCATEEIILQTPCDCEVQFERIGNKSPTASKIILKRNDYMVIIEGDLNLLESSASGIVFPSGMSIAKTGLGEKYHTFTLRVIPAKYYGQIDISKKFCNILEIKVYRAIFHNPECLLFRENIVRDDEDGHMRHEVKLRYDHFALVQQHYYKSPPIIERGYRQYLYDIYGRSYLDMVNNVAVIGHSHEAITEAARKQLDTLNTNSRFVYEILGKYTEKILSKVPAHIRDMNKLNTVLLVNSGSEATDLAMRIGRSVVTSRRYKAKLAAGEEDVPFQLNRDIICLQGAYHGVTTASDEVSTTLNDNPRSLETRAPWIHLVPMPNLYRGIYQLNHADYLNNSNQMNEAIAEISQKYVGLVKSKIDELVSIGKPPAVFIAEPLSGNAGGVELPYGYLKGVYEEIRAVGGLCISDEVQVGYSRLGSSFWGFEEHDVIPDIVTMAKAAGNGFPLGFVITSKDIINEFGDQEGSFFSSAGGSPLSCVIGHKVLEVLEEDNLQGNAKLVGKYLNEKLNDLAKRYPHIVGCIHGHGLYQGVELIEGPTKQPATEQACAICERLLELGVICHNTGDYSNVLKVKPPLYFNKDDADFFVSALEITFRDGW